jgi:hypothetical protein
LKASWRHDNVVEEYFRRDADSVANLSPRNTDSVANLSSIFWKTQIEEQQAQLPILLQDSNNLSLKCIKT